MIYRATQLMPVATTESGVLAAKPLPIDESRPFVGEQA
jgi:hypothetical protein